MTKSLDHDFTVIFTSLLTVAWLATVTWRDLHPGLAGFRANWPVCGLWLSVVGTVARFSAGAAWCRCAAFGFVLAGALMASCYPGR